MVKEEFIKGIPVPEIFYDIDKLSPLPKELYLEIFDYYSLAIDDIYLSDIRIDEINSYINLTFESLVRMIPDKFVLVVCNSIIDYIGELMDYLLENEYYESLVNIRKLFYDFR